MKLMVCAHCNDFISPFSEPRKPRWCQCGMHAVWWENPHTGALRIHRKFPSDRNAWVLGINNSFLMLPEPITAEDIKRIDDECPDSYLFKRIHSPLIRIRPGQSNDTGYAPLPSAPEESEKHG